MLICINRHLVKYLFWIGNNVLLNISLFVALLQEMKISILINLDTNAKNTHTIFCASPVFFQVSILRFEIYFHGNCYALRSKTSSNLSFFMRAILSFLILRKMSPVNFYLFTPITRKKRERQSLSFSICWSRKRQERHLHKRKLPRREWKYTKWNWEGRGRGGCIVFMKWQIKGDNVKLGRKSWE